MSDTKKKKSTTKKDVEMSLYVEDKAQKAKKGEASISLVQDGEMIECDRNVPKVLKVFGKKDEVVVMNRKKVKGYAPVVFAIILFSGLLFLNIYNQIKLDTVGNNLAEMNRQLSDLEAEKQLYTQKIAQKDKEVLEQANEYIEKELGMVKAEQEENGVYIELQLDDETLVVENEREKNGWTTLLSGVGRFFSDIFG